MDPIERENTSNNVERPAEEPRWQSPEEPTPVVPAPEKPKKSKAPMVLSLLLVLALAGAGVFGFMWYQQNGRVSDLESDLSSTRNKVTQLETSAKANAELDDEEEDIVTDTKSSASDTILKKAIEYSSARTGNQGFVNGTTSREGKIDKQTAEFAKVTVSSPTSPGTETIYLKASSDSWVVIGDGTEDMTMIENGFGLPKGF